MAKYVNIWLDACIGVPLERKYPKRKYPTEKGKKSYQIESKRLCKVAKAKRDKWNIEFGHQCVGAVIFVTLSM